jgi:methyl-accepting chemotaxis protein WspA
MKIRTKIILGSGLPLLMVSLLLAGSILRVLYVARSNTVERMMDSAAGYVAAGIDRDNARAMELSGMLAASQRAGLFGDRARSLALAREVLVGTPQITGAYFAYEPDADGNDAAASRSGLDPRALGKGGRFIPYWFRRIDRPGEIALEPLIDMEKSYYYRGVANRLQGRPEDVGVQLSGGISRLYRERPEPNARELRMITEPYVYNGKLMVEQTAPILRNGKFAGIAGVDRALDDISQELHRLRPYPTAEFILLSQRGRIVAATRDSRLRAMRLEDTPYADLLARLFRGELNQLLTLDDPVTGEPTLFIGKPIAHGNWYLLLSVPRAEITGMIISRGLMIALGFVLGVLLAVLVTIYVLRHLIARIEQAAATVTEVAAGDLTPRVDSAATDESGDMLRAIGRMVQSLDGLVHKIKDSSVEVTAAATEISASAQQQRESSSEFGASTSQIAASTNEISATSRELLQTMTQVSAATAATVEVANRGRSDLDRMEATMQQLLEATASISGKLAVISERANNIGAVVTTITRVADQTNLLSLNAAIEAEKAGEYGLGFSVVAREIRRLADQTAVATLDIERIVGEMQSSVSSGVMEMDRFDEQVRSGVQETTRIGTELEGIIGQVEGLGPRFEQAQQSMQAQVIGAGQINDAMMQLREMALVSGQSAERLHATSAQLLGAIQSLNTEVARFRTIEA